MKHCFQWMMPLVLMWCSLVVAESALDELLQRFPGQNQSETEQLAREVLRRGPETIAILCGMLRPFSAEDDSAVQFALNAITVYATRPDVQESERLAVVKGLLLGLDASQDLETKALIIRQIQFCGKEEAVAPLAAYLGDPQLGAPAAQALTAIGTPAAVQALADALGQAEGERRLPLITALGALHHHESIPAITALAQNEDAAVRYATSQSLRIIAAAPPVPEEPEPSYPTDSEAWRRIEAALDQAAALAAAGKRPQAARTFQQHVRELTDPAYTPLRSAALLQLVDVQGRSSLQYLLDAMKSDNPAYRAAALGCAGKIPGRAATRRWVKTLNRVSPEVQIEIIRMLGERGDPSAVPALKRMQKDAEPPLQRAIAIALVLLQQ